MTDRFLLCFGMAWRGRFRRSETRREGIGDCLGRQLMVIMAATAFASALAAPAQSQDVIPGITVPPIHQTWDENEVELVNGYFRGLNHTMAIGDPEAGGLSLTLQTDLTSDGDGRTHEYEGYLDEEEQYVPDEYFFVLGNRTESFTGQPGGVFNSKQKTGSILEIPIPQNTARITVADGTKYIFFLQAGYSPTSTEAKRWKLGSIERPNGEVVTLSYAVGTGIRPPYSLRSVQNNFGYQIKFIASGAGASRILFLNNAIDVCDPLATTCAGLTQSWPYIDVAGSCHGGGIPPDQPCDYTVSMSGDTPYTYHFEGSNQERRITQLTYPTGRVITMTHAEIPQLDDDNHHRRVTSFTRDGKTWLYNYQEVTGSISQTSFTNPLNQTGNITWSDSKRNMRSYTDELSRTTTFDYDANDRLVGVLRPGGDQIFIIRDPRNNITQVVHLGGPETVSQTAVYDATCVNRLTCNSPHSMTRGTATTDYAYSPAHGGLISLTRPAPTEGSARPQIRYAYETFTATYRNQAGQYISGTPVVLPTSVRQCPVGDTCATADQASESYGYTTAFPYNNLQRTSVIQGLGAVQPVTTLSYDVFGNQVVNDGPLPGTSDEFHYRYDPQRRLVGELIDPDGTGPAQIRATRTRFNGEDQVVGVDRGTVPDFSGQSWFEDFLLYQSEQTAYDAAGRPKHRRLIADSAVANVTHLNYDAAGRPLCEAFRMNPIIYSAEMSDAWTLANGCLSFSTPDGADRIIRFMHDQAGQRTNVISAYGTIEARYEQTTYTLNGLPETFEDGEGNVTRNVYDGVDRLIRVEYPHPDDGQPNPNDYEGYAYNGRSVIQSQRRRDGQTVYFEPDLLDRPIRALGGETFTYDNLDRVVTATLNGLSATRTYDSLGRVVSEIGPLGTVGYGYDVAGRRTSITWPDGVQVKYEFDGVAAMTAIRSSADALMATLDYDVLGRRTIFDRSGLSSVYSYDAASRLTDLQHLRSPGLNLSLGFTRNAATQIKSRTVSNSTFDWSEPAVGTQSYAVNGLNQYVWTDGRSIVHDARGNLTSDGIRSYSYDLANRLTAVSGAILQYDGFGRLYRTTSSTDRRFLYAEDRIIAEYAPNGTLLARHVPGPSGQEPLLSWPAASVTNGQWYFADHQESVMGATSDGGALLYTNTYDEYGRPSPLNQGLFQYTGQTWLAFADLYDYRARAYSPELGRFMQTDPSGYQDSLYWYAYVGNDPLNKTDPTGLQSYLPPGSGATLEQNREINRQIGRGFRALVNEVRRDPLGATIDGAMILGDILTVPSGEAAVGIGFRRGMAEASEAAAEGVIYRRTNPTTGREYIGRANNERLYRQRQQAHDRNRGTRHDYEVVERAEPGQALREAEQRNIDAGGGPTNQSNPNGGLENRRNEIRPGGWRREE